jgi:hypothetical protein
VPRSSYEQDFLRWTEETAAPQAATQQYCDPPPANRAAECPSSLSPTPSTFLVALATPTPPRSGRMEIVSRCARASTFES